jgi:heat shock protein HslJ
VQKSPKDSRHKRFEKASIDANAEEEKKEVIFLLLPFVILGMLTLSACGSRNSNMRLTEIPWLLIELEGEPPIPNTQITAEFDEEGRVGGTSGCNSYSTTYTVDGNRIKLGEEMIGTLMACPDPVMEQERVYLEALGAAVTSEIVDNELTLFDTDGNPLARYQAVYQELADTSWEVISYNTGTQAVTSVIIGTEITAEFSEEGQLSGNASCNQYNTTYETDGNKIKIGPAAVTRMLCSEPDGIMEQEARYLAALGTAETYKIQGLNMEMRTSEGSLVASFRRIEIP